MELALLPDIRNIHSLFRQSVFEEEQVNPLNNSGFFVVGRGRIELPTRRFSVLG
jgi:hypothetical protein